MQYLEMKKCLCLAFITWVKNIFKKKHSHFVCDCFSLLKMFCKITVFMKYGHDLSYSSVPHLLTIIYISLIGSVVLQCASSTLTMIQMSNEGQPTAAEPQTR